MAPKPAPVPATAAVAEAATLIVPVLVKLTRLFPTGVDEELNVPAVLVKPLTRSVPLVVR